MTPEELVLSWRDGALVFIGERSSPLVRPAAFVFVDPGGLSWVEPSYADPFGAASSSFHRRDGRVVLVGDGIELHGGEEPVEVLPFVSGIRQAGDRLHSLVRRTSA